MYTIHTSPQLHHPLHPHHPLRPHQLRHKAIVAMRRIGALDCLHDYTIYVLCSLLCAR